MTQLPFNPRTMTAKKALAALADHPDLTVGNWVICWPKRADTQILDQASSKN
jgi:hypothetical protein